MNYRLKLVFFIFLASFLSLSILIVNKITLLKTILENNTISKMNSIGNLLSVKILHDYLHKDHASIREAIKTASEQPFINFLHVLDNDGIIRFSSDKHSEGKTNAEPDSPGIDIKKNVFVKSFRIESRNNKHGSLQIAFYLVEMKKDLGMVLRWSLLLSLIALLVILPVSWYASEKLLQPLLEMKSVSREIARGNFTKKFKVERRDTIGMLGAALNDMADQLNDMTVNLDRKIQTATGELLEKTAALEKANEKLRELDKLKSEFVSMVSHELRTPLTGIIGFAQTLQNLELSEQKKRKYISIIENEGKRLAVLIEEFLDISKIETGNIELHMAEVDIRDIINDVLDTFTCQKGIRITRDLPKYAVRITADADRLKQVVLNLLTNAVRYTKPKGKICLRVQKDETSAVISVQDEGPGIRKEDIGNIFGKFYRGGDAITERHRGSGLGLAIAKGIIDIHKGKIWVESEPNKGSIFYFSIPANG